MRRRSGTQREFLKGVFIAERGERIGRKLSATGNGQGNITNLRMSPEHYFHLGGDPLGITAHALSGYGEEEMLSFLIFKIFAAFRCQLCNQFKGMSLADCAV